MGSILSMSLWEVQKKTIFAVDGNNNVHLVEYQVFVFLWTINSPAQLIQSVFVTMDYGCKTFHHNHSL